MPAIDGLRGADRPPVGHFELAVIAALDVERRCLDGRNPRIAVWQSGPGAARAAQAARAAIASGATALLSWGLAGALAPQLSAGVVVVPGTVLSEDGRRMPVNPDLRAALLDRLAGHRVISKGDLLTATQVLADAAAKRAAASHFAAVACDMESAAIAEVAAGAGVAFAAVRVVTDELTDGLPEHVAQWIDAAGNPRLAPVLRAAARPSQWSALLLVALRFRRARRAMSRIAGPLFSTDFCGQTARA